MAGRPEPASIDSLSSRVSWDFMGLDDWMMLGSLQAMGPSWWSAFWPEYGLQYCEDYSGLGGNFFELRR